MPEPPRPTFEVHLETPTETLVAGFAEYGLAGLTAADYLTEQLGLSQTGHVTAEGLPAVTPFEGGVPRHHTRLYSAPDRGLTIGVGELFVPPGAAEGLGAAILECTDEHDIEEAVVLSGLSVPHGPDDHRAFYVATEDYRRVRLEDTDVAPMPGGFLDGVSGALMERAIDSSLRACVLSTPVHAQAPDLDAALRLIEGFDDIYDLDVDTGPMESFAATVAEQYEELAARLESRREAPEDRMYM